MTGPSATCRCCSSVSIDSVLTKAIHLNVHVHSKFVSCRKYMLLLRILQSILERQLLRSRQSSEPQVLFLGRGSGGKTSSNYSL